MLKLKELLRGAGSLSAVILFGSVLVGCGSGGGTDNIICGGDCSSSSDEDELSVADSDGFTFGADLYNPESYNINNVEVKITIGLNDFEGNPPPDGTIVLFDAEAGTIPSQCELVSGQCTVTWLSGDPRPGYGPNPMGEIDGRFIIFARALGAESFTDLNNNNRFDGISEEPFIDLPEPFLDINENGVYDFGEEFEDSPGGTDGVYDYADGLYNGPRCNADCSDASSIYVGGTYELGSYTFVMSTSSAYIWDSGDAEILRDYTAISGNALPAANTTIDISGGAIYFNDVFVGDGFGNSMASGTTVAISASNVNVSGTLSYTFRDTQIAAQYMPFTLQTDGVSGADGELKITITAPSGLVSEYTWPVTD